MSDEFDFEARLGNIGHKKSARPKPFVRQVVEVTYKSEFKTKRKSSFIMPHRTAQVPALNLPCHRYSTPDSVAVTSFVRDGKTLTVTF